VSAASGVAAVRGGGCGAARGHRCRVGPALPHHVPCCD